MLQNSREMFWFERLTDLHQVCAAETTSNNTATHTETACSVQATFYMDEDLESRTTAGKAKQKNSNICQLLDSGVLSLANLVNKVPEDVAYLNRKAKDDEVKVFAINVKNFQFWGLERIHPSKTLLVGQKKSET